MQKIAQSAHFECEVFHYDPARPILLVTWPGTEPSLPCLLLNSHTDVVPAVRVCINFELPSWPTNGADSIV